MKTETLTAWHSADEWAIVGGVVLRPGEAFGGPAQPIIAGTEAEIRAEANRRGLRIHEPPAVAGDEPLTLDVEELANAE